MHVHHADLFSMTDLGTDDQLRSRDLDATSKAPAFSGKAQPLTPTISPPPAAANSDRKLSVAASKGIGTTFDKAGVEPEEPSDLSDSVDKLVRFAQKHQEEVLDLQNSILESAKPYGNLNKHLSKVARPADTVEAGDEIKVERRVHAILPTSPSELIPGTVEVATVLAGRHTDFTNARGAALQYSKEHNNAPVSIIYTKDAFTNVLLKTPLSPEATKDLEPVDGSGTALLIGTVAHSNLFWIDTADEGGALMGEAKSVYGDLDPAALARLNQMYGQNEQYDELVKKAPFLDVN